jgi:hypothetical protein
MIEIHSIVLRAFLHESPFSSVFYDLDQAFNFFFAITAFIWKQGTSSGKASFIGFSLDS